MACKQVEHKSRVLQTNNAIDADRTRNGLQGGVEWITDKKDNLYLGLVMKWFVPYQKMKWSL